MINKKIKDLYKYIINRLTKNDINDIENNSNLQFNELKKKEKYMKYKLEKKIVKKGFPTSSKKYEEAHSEASNAEKKKYPKGYKVLKKLDAKVSKNTLIGKNTKSSKLEVSKIVPKKYRNEVAYHEKIESKAIKRLSKKK